MSILKVITSFLLTILPIVILIRDWKFHDKRTKKHHNITRTIIVFWCIGSILATIFVCVDSAQIKELITGKDTLIAQNKGLSAKLEKATLPIQKIAADVETIIGIVDLSPNFDQNMWSMLTGIPAPIFKDYHEALDYYELKDYKKTAERVASAISAYESVDKWDLKNYDVKQHKEQVSGFYLLAAKTNMMLQNHSLVYEYSKKALKANTTYYTFYLLSVAAYNIKNYKESLENINKAIDLTPSDSKYQQIIEQYQNIKDKCLTHLKLTNR